MFLEEAFFLFKSEAQFSSLQLLSRVQLFSTSWTAACQASLSIANSQSLHKLMSIESVMPSNHLILCSPLLLPPSVFTSIRVFSNESVLGIRWPKYWSFNFNISPSNEYSGMISFRIDWLDLLAAQGTLKSFLQHHSSKASILRHSVHFSSVQLLSCVQLFATPWTVGCQASLSITNSAQLSFNSHIHTWPLEKLYLWLDRPLLAKECLCFLICYLGWS